ncbi:MAG: hypothetical protein IT292_05115 [Deltaproteobacteria bacterium]|nr:hypothetical protein [Deltaproteobacteria bacterium]
MRSFQWTTAVHALTVIFLKYKLAQILTMPTRAQISGKHGSLASSLDDSLYKEPE